MPRRPREELAGAIHHVYARGNNRRRIYADDVDRVRYLALLGIVVLRQRWHCLAYCLMDNHVHLLIETAAPNLGEGMRRLHGAYGRAYNDRHSADGHLFQGRYGSVRVKDDAHLLAVTAYIAANPVQAGLAADPSGWPWTSHAVLRSPTAPSWLEHRRLLAYLEAYGPGPESRYAAAIAERLAS